MNAWVLNFLLIFQPIPRDLTNFIHKYIQETMTSVLFKTKFESSIIITKGTYTSDLDSAKKKQKNNKKNNIWHGKPSRCCPHTNAITADLDSLVGGALTKYFMHPVAQQPLRRWKIFNEIFIKL